MDGTQNQPTSQALVLLFNEEIQPGSVTDETIILRDSRQARAAGSFSIKGSEVRFTPLPNLRASEKYTLEITSNVRGVNGNRLKENVSLSFTTDQGTKVVT